MGDEQDRQAHLPLEVLDQVQHLALEGAVQGGGGLVGEQDLGASGQGHGQADALAHAAGEGVGEILGPFRSPGDADPVQPADRVGPGFGPAHPEMAPADLGDLAAHPHARIERGERLLEHHPQHPAAQPGPDRVVHAVAGPALDDQAASDPERGGLQEAEQGQGGQALARAALAHQAQGPAGPQAEFQALHQAAPGGQGDGQSLGLQHRGHRASPARAWPTQAKPIETRTSRAQTGRTMRHSPSTRFW